MKNIEIRDDYRTNWLPTYTNKIIFFVIFILIIISVVSYWEHHKKHQDFLANEKFNLISYAMSINDNLTVKNHAIELLNKPNTTPYPRLAGLMLAKVFIMENNLMEAEKILIQVIRKKNKKDSIWHLANLRLIKVLLLQNNLVEAEKIINVGISTKKFISSYQELFGDLLVVNKKLDDAHFQYQQSIKNLPENIMAPWLQLKINELNINN